MSVVETVSIPCRLVSGDWRLAIGEWEGAGNSLACLSTIRAHTHTHGRAPLTRTTTVVSCELDWSTNDPLQLLFLSQTSHHTLSDEAARSWQPLPR